MTTFALPADSLLSSRDLKIPAYPEPSGFSLRGLFGLVVPQRWVRVTWHAARDPSWFSPTVLRLAELASLPDNWDSYGGRQLSPRNFQMALAFLADVLADDTELPWVVPLPSGGVQLEWHKPGLDVEVIIDDDDSSVLLIEDEVERELSLVDSIGPLRRLMRRLEVAGEQ
jgi:hypothetical protein